MVFSYLLAGLAEFFAEAVQVGIASACANQFMMSALFYDIAFMHDNDVVGFFDGRKSVGNHQCGTVLQSGFPMRFVLNVRIHYPMRWWLRPKLKSAHFSKAHAQWRGVDVGRRTVLNRFRQLQCATLAAFFWINSQAFAAFAALIISSSLNLSA